MTQRAGSAKAILVKQPAQTESPVTIANDDAIDIQECVQPLAKPNEVPTVVVGILVKGQEKRHACLDNGCNARGSDHPREPAGVERRSLPRVRIVEAHDPGSGRRVVPNVLDTEWHRYTHRVPSSSSVGR
jgi:hypothetical protein